MKNIWLIADTHFGHENACTKFKRADGSPLRPFANATEMNEAMVTNFNERVKPTDKCYFLGDVVLARKHLSILSLLHGDKVLIKGNHDIYKLNDYTTYFRDVRACQVMGKTILTHIPIHESEIRRFGTNIHGHLHDTRVLKDGIIDPRYYCVSVEHHNFAPISYEDVLLNIKKENEKYGRKDQTQQADSNYQTCN